MKNIHLIPTDKPSKLFIHNAFNDLRFDVKQIKHDNNQNIYITSDVDINENDYIITSDGKLVQVSYLLSNDVGGGSKVVLTTDQDLILDGVQSIDDEFLEWFVKNPTCEGVEVIVLNSINVLVNNYKPYYKIIIPKEERTFEDILDEGLSKGKVLLEELRLRNAKRELLADAAYEDCKKSGFNNTSYVAHCVQSFINGANWQQERMYSEEDLREAFRQGMENVDYSEMYGFDSKLTEQNWFEQFKKK